MQLRWPATRLGLVLVGAFVVNACGDDDSQCPRGQQFSEKLMVCYSPQCPAGAVYEESRDSCRRPCPPGFAYWDERRVCYACPDAAISENEGESRCSLPTEEDGG